MNWYKIKILNSETIEVPEVNVLWICRERKDFKVRDMAVYKYETFQVVGRPLRP